MFLLALLLATAAAGLSIQHAPAESPYTVIGHTNISHLTDFTSAEYPWLLETERLLKTSKFAMKPAALIARAKVVINNGIFKAGYDGSDIAENFVFQFPIVGPLSKKDYLEAVSGFDLQAAFPGQQPSIFYDFRVDPFSPNTVCFTSIFSALHSGDGSKILGKATFRHVTTPPQAYSLAFDREGMVTKFTGGYVMDRERGNSGGLGGLFGVLYAVGRPLPFPEGKPYRPSIKFKIFTLLQRVIAAIQKKK